MGFWKYMSEFAGKSVVPWDSKIDKLDPDVIYRIGVPYTYETDVKWTDVFAPFIEMPNVSKTTGLVIGPWTEPFDNSPDLVIEALVASRESLPNLKALFIPDMTGEDCEISWITQSDLTPIFKAFPNLEIVGIRGGNGLNLGGLQHDKLKTLIIQSGGLDANLIRDVLKAKLPELEHLELYLGTDDYGANSTPDDFKPLFEGKIFPKLKYLGLRDSIIADELAIALVSAPILERIDTLDLSKGTLGDKGAQALLDNPLIKNLIELDLHYNFISYDMTEKLDDFAKENDIIIDHSDSQEDDDDEDGYRYVAVGE